jgi:hypothetical protein
LYFDEDADQRVARALQHRGFDVETPTIAGRLHASDEDQLTYAAGARRALITHNIGDFPALHARWLMEGHQHWGLIIVPGRPAVAVILHRLERLLAMFSADEFRNRLEFLSAEYDSATEPQPDR